MGDFGHVNKLSGDFDHVNEVSSFPSSHYSGQKYFSSTLSALQVSQLPAL